MYLHQYLQQFELKEIQTNHFAVLFKNLVFHLLVP